MSSYDPNQPASWTPPTPENYGTMPGETQTVTQGDRWGIAALAVFVTALISCIPLVNCLAPFVPLVVGIMTLTKAKTAVNPQNARLYGWLATGLGIVYLLGIVVILVVYGSLIVNAINNPEFRNR